ncbi:MAG: hypothetical protein WC971_04965 [Coriobacteriia bacterium]
MTLNPAEVFLPQLIELLTEYLGLRSKSQHDDVSDLPEDVTVRFVTRARAAIHRIAGPHSRYAAQCEEIISENAITGWKATQLAGVLGSLEADLRSGYMESASELIRGELFGDFLEMAEHLAREGYKDPAAVVAGSALEAHLRQLCSVAGVDAINDEGRPRQAESLNAALAKAGAYTKLDQKSVTSWLGLRNDAAHGHYDRYGVEQVNLLIAGVRDFIARNP